MGKQKRKKPQQREKVSKFTRICERCGNENFSYKKIYRCKYCDWKNGAVDECIGVVKAGGVNG